jgi:3',5'-cyclic AMP phosphodiesterase CpdA
MNWLSRRDFLNAAALSTPVLFGWDLIGGLAPKTVRFGVCTDPHQDIMHDAEDRLRRFIEMAKKDRLDFIIQLGDFCRPYEKNRRFLAIWEEFPGPRFHTLGNHDNDGGFSWQEVLDFWKIPQRHYSFDQGGWHFVVLDGNEIKPDNRAPGYPRYIGQEQRTWLRENLKKSDAPTIIFSHQTLEDPGGMENREEVRSILEQTNAEAGWRKVGACMSGHHHIDFATQISGIHYVQINSMSYLWLGEKLQHVRYSPEIDKAYPNIKYTAPYRDSLFATITLSPELGMKIAGKRSEFVGPSPWELGMEEVKGTSLEKRRLVPRISDRELKVQTPG